jgi:K(+)-stimulated pyrophosphate-energized sodium pump
MSFDALIPVLFGAIGLAVAYFLCQTVQSHAQGTAAVREAGEQIHLGGMAFMRSVQSRLTWVLGLLFLVLWIAFDFSTALSFVIGALTCAGAGHIGMNNATRANVPAATAAAERSTAAALSIAFSSASIMGLAVASLGLLGLGLVYLFNGNSPAGAHVIVGFGLGASVIALFSRIGGGIVRHGADIDPASLASANADSAEADSSEADARSSAAIIVSGIGKNVGDIAGMGAELFLSYSGAVIASIAMAATMSAMDPLGARASLMFMPLALACAGLVCSIMGIMLTRSFTDKSPRAALRAGTISTVLAFLVVSLFLTLAADAATNIWWTMVSGAVGGVIIALTSGYFTGGEPVITIARAGQRGTAAALLAGFVVGAQSVAIPMLIICAVVALSHEVAGLYGIGIAAVSMLATAGFTMAISACAPITNNACAIAKIADLDDETQQITDSLREAGDGTAAMSKGFSVGAAALAALALIFAFVQTVATHVPGFSLVLSNSQVLSGLLIGAVLPFVIAAITMAAAADAAAETIAELHRQLREIPRRSASAAKAGMTRCVDVTAGAAIAKMTPPGVIAVLAPLVVGFGISPEALGGMLAGSLLSGVVLALSLTSAGSAWASAKQHIETGNLGGRNSDAHAALIVGARIGGPCKDTCAPSLTVLITVMAIVSLLIAPHMS